MTRALAQRGVFSGLAAELVAAVDGPLIGAWVGWFDRQHGIGPGGLVDGIRSGQPPAEQVKPPTMTERQAQYGHSVEEWLADKMPEVFTTDAKVVEATRKTYGDLEADRLAASTGAHPAAFAAVLALHYSDGKLTVKKHGPVIRAAVKAFDDRAIRDLEAIAKDRRRTTEIRGTAA